MGTRRLARRIAAFQAEVTAWQEAHREQMRALERRMTEIEMSVASAEDDAHHAAVQMALMRTELIPRLEELEQRMEIELLVAQGRLPSEHLSF